MLSRLLNSRDPAKTGRPLDPLLIMTTLAVLAWAAPAMAYPGERLLNFGAQYIIAPLGIFAVIIALAGSFFRPDMVKGAIYAAIICAVLFFVIKMSSQLTSAMQSS